MLALHWECIDYNLNKIKGILKTTMLAPLLFTKSIVWYISKEGKSSRHYMLAVPLFMVFPSEYSYLSMKDKYQTFYVSLFGISYHE